MVDIVSEYFGHLHRREVATVFDSAMKTIALLSCFSRLEGNQKNVLNKIV